MIDQIIYMYVPEFTVKADTVHVLNAEYTCKHCRDMTLSTSSLPVSKPTADPALSLIPTTQSEE